MSLFPNILIYPLTIIISTSLHYLTYLKFHCNHYIIHPFKPYFKFNPTLIFYYFLLLLNIFISYSIIHPRYFFD